MRDAVHELLDEAIASRKAAAFAAKRAHKEQMVQAAFDGEFADQLAQAYADLTPSELARARYAREFQLFRDWVSHDGLSALPAGGAVIANYLIRLGLDGAPLSRIKGAADAIRYYHSVAEAFVDEGYIACAFGILARLSPDDGGGRPLPVTNITVSDNEMPLAAQN
jgi:hypothetical protein